MKAEKIIEHQPVGTLIVDATTVVTFANPAAAAMLGVARDRFVGEVFGLPLTAGEVTDVNVPGEGRSVRTLAMRVTELPGSGGSRLVSLFDVSGRVRLYEHEHRLVESLQRSLLIERMPGIPGVSLAAATFPATAKSESGVTGTTPSRSRAATLAWRSGTSPGMALAPRR